MSILSRPEFHNEEAAYAYVEARVWANGRVCPHCGETERTGKLGGKSTRIGTYKCYQCRKPFTVKIGTIFEASHVPMNLWLQAIYLMSASKKGISSNQLHRTLGVTLKTAWFMSHRIREAMRDDTIGGFGAGGGAVEVDETFIGREPGTKPGRAYHHKMKVVSLVDRETGRAKSIVVDKLTIAAIAPILRENIAREATLYTDEALHYRKPGKAFAAHGVVEHGKDEYVRGDVHTNTIEGFFSIFKRGMKGVYQHCGKKHLHRYMAEFDFRYSNRAALDVSDILRADIALRGVVGKRLTYAQ
ncbi:IS1595 family transposase [Tabrizicola sp.]|jgi:transposase-like protein|uniref:IS1595 family transposase n=1 Tax=Tabrizicola sp. TaxID=2005166 RepID=UPI0025EF49EA|nr:IS1595 family transposase [Tabrizicola sp.]MBY0349490.1 IS1595 family transposase [Tabrizicola sp.]MDK2774772.1 IS1595 family transposase [Tabrizicola sp.]